MIWDVFLCIKHFSVFKRKAAFYAAFPYAGCFIMIWRLCKCTAWILQALERRILFAKFRK
jgi:hypothetical protein